MYYVYVLQSKFNGQSYVGSTNNLKSRFEQHNNGRIISTKRYMPWKLFYYEAYESEELARVREKRLKNNGNAMKELKKRIGLKFFKSGAGFTLIELLVVVAVVGIMAAAVMVFLNPADQIKKAQDSKRKGDLSQIQKALETYYNDNGKYPPTGGKDFEPNYAIIGLDGNAVKWGTPWIPYMATLPKDPSSSKNYVYNDSEDRQSYYIYASLDRETYVLDNFPFGAGCGSEQCNYGVSSSNVSP